MSSLTLYVSFYLNSSLSAPLLWVRVVRHAIASAPILLVVICTVVGLSVGSSLSRPRHRIVVLELRRQPRVIAREVAGWRLVILARRLVSQPLVDLVHLFLELVGVVAEVLVAPLAIAILLLGQIIVSIRVVLLLIVILAVDTLVVRAIV